VGWKDRLYGVRAGSGYGPLVRRGYHGVGRYGGNFILGKANTAGAATKLTSSVAGATLQLVNNGTGTALNLSVPSGKAPMTVNSSKKVANLNADKLDGHEAPMWAVVNANGSIPSSSDPAILSFQTGDTGVYRISFPRDVSGCAATATIHDINTGEISTSRPSTHLDSIGVLTQDTGGPGGSGVNRPFELVVNC
jgi:hypothetical protein